MNGIKPLYNVGSISLGNSGVVRTNCNATNPILNPLPTFPNVYDKKCVIIINTIAEIINPKKYIPKYSILKSKNNFIVITSIITAKIANVDIATRRELNSPATLSPVSRLRAGNRMLNAAAAISNPNTKKNGAIALP